MIDLINERISYINKYGFNLSLKYNGNTYYIDMNNGKNECLNGNWPKADLQRLYDQTSGFAMALIRIYGYKQKSI